MRWYLASVVFLHQWERNIGLKIDKPLECSTMKHIGLWWRCWIAVDLHYFTIEGGRSHGRYTRKKIQQAVYIIVLVL